MTREEAIDRIENHIRIHSKQESFRACYIQEALEMAIDALKEQEPRVMTLEELIDSYSQETIWFEERPNRTIKQLTQDGIVALTFVGLLHNWNGYGIVWRCWTSRPTDEQREATAWN